MKIWAFFLCLFAPGLVFGQSLSDAAEKEKERRKKAAAATASPAPVFTNESLDTTKGQLANDPKALAPVQGRLPDPTAESPNEATWRAQFAAAQARLTRAKENSERWKQTPVLPHYGAQGNGVAAFEKVKAELDAAQKAFDDLIEAGRKANVPPGWLR